MDQDDPCDDGAPSGQEILDRLDAKFFSGDPKTAAKLREKEEREKKAARATGGPAFPGRLLGGQPPKPKPIINPNSRGARLRGLSKIKEPADEQTKAGQVPDPGSDAAHQVPQPGSLAAQVPQSSGDDSQVSQPGSGELVSSWLGVYPATSNFEGDPLPAHQGVKRNFLSSFGYIGHSQGGENQDLPMDLSTPKKKVKYVERDPSSPHLLSEPTESLPDILSQATESLHDMPSPSQIMVSASPPSPVSAGRSYNISHTPPPYT